MVQTHSMDSGYELGNSGEAKLPCSDVMSPPQPAIIYDNSLENTIADFIHRLLSDCCIELHQSLALNQFQLKLYSVTC